MDTSILTAARGSSIDKLDALINTVSVIEPDSPSQAAMLALFGQLAPHVRGHLPGEADELDDLLLAVAHWCVNLRSDDASPRVISAPDRPLELVGGDEPGS